MAIKQKDHSIQGFLIWGSGLFNPLILLSYGFITVFTPRLNAFDSAGTKFLALAILNLVAFFFLLLRKEQRPPNKIFSAFFSNRIGFLYGLFLLVNLLSFLKAINPAESLISFTKLFTVFTVVLIIAAILRANKKYLAPLAIGMSLLLLIDAATVFYQMGQLMEKYPNFFDLFRAFPDLVKHNYSNKNILSSAMFVKLPFALWLWSFRRGIARIVGLIATFAGIIALMPLSSRAFYVGLALLSGAYVLFIIIRLFVDRKRWKTALVSVVIVALFPLIFYLGWMGLSHYFPTVKNFNLKDRITVRLSTIDQDASAGTRTVSWRRSIKLIREEPLLGVGAGNWKINVLKYENQTAPDYKYYYYNHNDFVQTTAETGILGGLLFLSLFIGVGWAFLYAFFKGPSSGSQYEYLFIPAFGMLCYSVDAFFNFPFDRPEIQSLFAIFMGIGIAFSPKMKLFETRKVDLEKKNEHVTRYASRVKLFITSHASRITTFVTRHASRVTPFLLPILMVLMTLSSIYVLYLNFRSLQYQGYVKYEVEKGNLTIASSVFMAGFPSIPTISVEGVPIAILKTRYLFNESRFDEAIDLLKRENPSPWESRREYFLSLAYKMKGNSDSVIAYALKVFKLKPLFTDNIDRLCKNLEEREQYEEAATILDDYRKMDSLSPKRYQSWFTELQRKATIKRVEFYYFTAQNQFRQQKYREAADNFTRIIEKEPGLQEAWEKRAWCYFYLNEPKKCVPDIDHLVALGVKNKGLEELRKKVTR